MYIYMYVEVLWMLGKEGSLQPTCYHFFESKTPLQAVVSRACKNHGVSRCRLRSGQWVLASIVHVERTQNEVIVQHGRLFAPLVTPSLVYHEKTMNKLDIFRWKWPWPGPPRRIAEGDQLEGSEAGRILGFGWFFWRFPETVVLGFQKTIPNGWDFWPIWFPRVEYMIPAKFPRAG